MRSPFERLLIKADYIEHRDCLHFGGKREAKAFESVSKGIVMSLTRKNELRGKRSSALAWRKSRYLGDTSVKVSSRQLEKGAKSWKCPG